MVFDVLDNSLFRCAVATDAQRFVHSLLKNGFELLGDGALSSWLRDESAMTEVDECVRRIATDLCGYSGAAVVEQVGPLRVLPVADRERLRQRLDEAFHDVFDENVYQERILNDHESLMRAIREFRTSWMGTNTIGLASVRAEALRLRRTIESLPHGFCLPAPPVE